VRLAAAAGNSFTGVLVAPHASLKAPAPLEVSA
jgi:hypothetical protein